ncbi:MAG: ROK family protein [Bacteroidales bacterium]|jgi:glucokinase|nr:ROK family protein [Bacteroidales bacterium]
MQKLAIGIDIGGTTVSYGLVTEQGEVKLRESFPTDNYRDINDFIKYLAERINHATAGLDSGHELSGVGIGAPNGNYYKGTIEHAPNLNWKGIVPITDLLAQKINLPVYLTNDANAAAVGEMRYGGARNMKNFITITLGTGLGSGFVANGSLILGHDGFAGEFGHTTVFHDGRECGCGKRGCLETYVSATGIKRTVVKLLSKAKMDSILRDYSYRQITSEQIYKAAMNGDQLAIEAFEFTGKILGMKLADAITILSPEAIFLAGGLANAGKLIFEPTKKYMEEFNFPIYKNKVKLLSSSLPENDAAILGAAALVWESET